MSSIDQVIARSRQKGNFTERKRFTVARANAIRKMRQFALADPHYYVLEIIQSAIANGASYIDVSTRETEFVFSYIGGGYSKDDLGQLFDFLFAAKSDMSYSALRQLALGVNALMLMEPDEIVIESGDGTLEQTTRIVFQGGKDIVDVGTPDSPLRGTFVRAKGLKRRKIKGRSTLSSTDYGPPETRAIEERCLCAPVPILVNDRAPFGFSTLRNPSIYGFSRVISIDEGDLYGTLGIMERSGHKPSFKILTFGAWIQTVQHALIPGHRMGGIINFDGLNKTADHAAIVRDDRLGELWVRLVPYARQLLRGDTDAHTYDIRTMDNVRLPIRDLRKVLAEATTILIAPPSATRENQLGQRAMRIAEVLDAIIMRASPSDSDPIRFLARPGTKILQPNLANADDVRFYEQPVLPDPPRPWIIGAIEVEALAARIIIDKLFKEYAHETPLRARSEWSKKLGFRELANARPGAIDPLSGEASGGESISATIFTPRHVITGSDEMLVRIVSAERLVWAGRIPSNFPGHVLQITIEDVLPNDLREVEGFPQEFGIAEALAHIIAEHAREDFARATRRALESVRQDDDIPGSALALMILAAIARDSIIRLRSRDGEEVGLEITMLESYPVELAGIHIFRTLDGELRSMRQVVEVMRARAGLVYGVIESVPADLEGIDTSEVLSLIEAEERLLSIILGPASYVRIDARDVLASLHEPNISVRDIAVGLRHDYPKGELMLLEGSCPSPWEPTSRAKTYERLINVLRAVWRDPKIEEEEQRRQALRHLQWYLIKATAAGAPTHGLEDLPLFVSIDGEPCSLAGITDLAAKHGDVLYMGDGRCLDATFFAGSDPLPARAQGLALNPFLFGLLGELFEVRPSFDFDLTDAEAIGAASDETLFVVSEEFDRLGIRGTLGIPLARPDDPSVLFLAHDGQRATPVRSVVRRFGIVGVLRHTDEKEVNLAHLEQALYETSQHIITRLLLLLPTLEPKSSTWTRAVEALLLFSDQHYQLTITHQGRLSLDVHNPLAERVLNLQLFDTAASMPVSGMRLLRELCANTDMEQPGATLSPSREFAQDLAKPLRDWIDHAHDPTRLVRLPHKRAQTDRLGANMSAGIITSAIEPGHDPLVARLEATIYYWIESLREDDVELTAIRIIDRSEGERLGRLNPSLRGSWNNVRDAKLPFCYIITPSRHHYLVGNREHWLLQRSLERFEQDPEAIAWATLSAYAYINEVLDFVTNTHELAFQARLIRALQGGEIEPREPGDLVLEQKQAREQQQQQSRQ